MFSNKVSFYILHLCTQMMGKLTNQTTTKNQFVNEKLKKKNTRLNISRKMFIHFFAESEIRRALPISFLSFHIKQQPGVNLA